MTEATEFTSCTIDILCKLNVSICFSSTWLNYFSYFSSIFLFSNSSISILFEDCFIQQLLFLFYASFIPFLYEFSIDMSQSLKGFRNFIWFTRDGIPREKRTRIQIAWESLLHASTETVNGTFQFELQIATGWTK